MATQLISSPLVDGHPPPWASGWGQDEYGYYAEFSLSTGPRYWDFVTQRMRWIPPGTFDMGSPDDEAERNENEEQREVTITTGFWLADTTCRQELWQAVMTENPSNFRGHNLPVEKVSYDDVLGFFEKISTMISGLSLEFPTEAQWEYACRAGTATPFSFGANITTDEANFNGNYPYDGADKGEYHKRTIASDALSANRWGLFQMHGNVWEWCRDWYGSVDRDAHVNPSGPGEGSFRVFRGGSWNYDARDARSAYRFWIHPGDRNFDLGFRCLSSVSQVAEQVSASIGEPRDEAR